jgi:hypothetical protein
MFINSKNTFILNILTIIISLLSNIKYNNPLIFLIIALGLLGASAFNIFFMIIKVMHNSIKIEKVFFSLFSLILSYTMIYVALKNYDMNSFYYIMENEETKLKNDSIVDSYKNFISEFFDMSYFTIVTLSTVGYGDIIPKSRTARFFVMTQILFGILVLSILFTKTF